MSLMIGYFPASSKVESTTTKCQSFKDEGPGLTQNNMLKSIGLEGPGKYFNGKKSAKKTGELTITPNHIIKYNKNWGPNGEYQFKTGLLSTLKSLGFKVDKRKSGKEEGEGGDLYPYTNYKLSRTKNGNTISIEYHDGICGYVEIKFSNSKEKQEFENKIKNLPHLERSGNEYYCPGGEGVSIEIKGNIISFQGYCI